MLANSRRPAAGQPGARSRPAERRRRDLPRRHRADHPDRPEPAGHRRGRRAQRGQQIPPRRAAAPPARPDVHTGPAGHLQRNAPGPTSSRPAITRSQPRTVAAGHLSAAAIRAVTLTGRPSQQRRADHLGRVRPPQQHRDRQQHMRDQARRAAGPPRPQRPSIPRTPRGRAHPHGASTPGQPGQSSCPAVNRDSTRT